MDFKYGNMLSALAIAFLLSSGMPIMYPIAAAYFFVTYWVDKWRLFRCQRRPVKFDNYLAKHALQQFKLILIFHILGFLLMFQLTPIFAYESQSEHVSLFAIFFLVVVLALIGYFCVWTICLRSVLKALKACCSDKLRLQDAAYFEDDFYSCISYSTLR